MKRPTLGDIVSIIFNTMCIALWIWCAQSIDLLINNIIAPSWYIFSILLVFTAANMFLVYVRLEKLIK